MPVAEAEMDVIFSSPYEDIRRARDTFDLANSMPGGMSFPELDAKCFEAYENGRLVIVGAEEVGIRAMMNAIRDKGLNRREYRTYADLLIQRVVGQVPPAYDTGEAAGIAISVRGGLPFEKPLFERLHTADTGFTEQTRHEVTMDVTAADSKMRSFRERHTFAADFMVATGGSMVDLLTRAGARGAHKCTVLGGFATPQAIVRLLELPEPKVEKIITLPLEAGLIVLGERARNFIFGGIANKFENFSREELEAMIAEFMLGDHGDRYYKDADLVEEEAN